MVGRLVARMDGRTDGQTGQTDGQLDDGQADGRTDGWTDRQWCGRTDGQRIRPKRTFNGMTSGEFSGNPQGYKKHNQSIGRL